MNKSSVTNLISLLIIFIGYLSPPIYNNIIISMGVFALSGSLTNWIAIHMLFEKIPLLYGSGVIPNRFEDFKIGIKNLIIEEFFNKNHIEKFLTQNKESLIIEKDNILNKINFDKIFENLMDAIIESPLGSMIEMFGGKESLKPLKEPIIEKLKIIVNDLIKDNKDNITNNTSENIITKVEKIIDERLNELTPKIVKEIIKKMIKNHLGWLVVWGGVFGGLIGIIYAVIK